MISAVVSEIKDFEMVDALLYCILAFPISNWADVNMNESMPWIIPYTTLFQFKCCLSQQ
jgi:hypothetical protein